MCDIIVICDNIVRDNKEHNIVMCDNIVICDNIEMCDIIVMSHNIVMCDNILRDYKRK